MSATLDQLGPPPVQSNYYVGAVKVPWNVYDNDSLGDCVPCDTAHGMMLRTANASRIVVPTVADVVSGLYTPVGGYQIGNEATDNGCDEQAMCAYMNQTGWLGHKSASFGAVDHSVQDHLKWAVQLFGSCRIGLNLPGYAENQFEAGQTWTVSTSGDQSTEGHDVPLVDYRNGVFYCVTWGKLIPVAPPFLTAYCDEAWAEVFPDFITAQGTSPSGFDLAGLVSRQQELAA